MTLPGLLSDKSVLNACLYVVGAVIGQLFYWVYRWSEGEEWVLVNFRRTVAAVIVNVGSMAAVVAAGTVDNMTVAAAFATGVTLGIAADSVINKGTRKQWTKKEREEKKK